MRIFYARASTADQKSGLAGQIERAKALGIGKDHIFAELVSGANTTNRPKLKECLRFIRKGDVLVCTKLDRLARSMTDLAEGSQGRQLEGARPAGDRYDHGKRAAAVRDPRLCGRVRTRTD